MKYYITVDGGTTNTRVYLVFGGRVVCSLSLGLGSGDTLSKERLIPKLREAILKITAEGGICENDVSAIIMSGMISSEFGVKAVSHVPVPAGIEEIRGGAYFGVIDEISPIPCCVIGGVRCFGDTLETSDVMRGEETELIGIMDKRSGDFNGGLFVLPGSHSKLISVDGAGRIKGFSTMLTGEMIAALSKSTILQSSVDLGSGEPPIDSLIHGYQYAVARGVNEALFKTRVLHSFIGKDKEYVYGFFMGAVLSGEITRICSLAEGRVIIGGRAQIRGAMARLLREVSDKEIIELGDDEVGECVALGAVKIYEYGERGV